MLSDFKMGPGKTEGVIAEFNKLMGERESKSFVLLEIEVNGLQFNIPSTSLK